MKKQNNRLKEGKSLFHKIKHIPKAKQAELITTELVKINSINGTKGEAEIADYLVGFISEIPYFKVRQKNLWVQSLKEDHLNRKNVFALLEGTTKNRNTVIFHCHLDTVGVEDFGPIKDIAFDPEALQQYFAQLHTNEKLKQEALSNEWMFGRGSLDMKSGIAVHLVNLIHLAKNQEKLSGNVLFMVNPVEENQHTGIIEAISELKRIKHQKKLQILLAINNDFCTEKYEGDPKKYIYTGSAGKLLVSFYIRGKEVHVGETIYGVDPTMISSEINRRINNNMELAENLPGELVLPPSCLYQRDSKDFYNVQTPISSYLYFNYFIYESTPKQVIERLVKITKEASTEIENYLALQYKTYLKHSNLPTIPYSWEVEVLTYGDYVSQLKDQGVNVEKIEENIMSEYGELLEPRLLCFKIIEALQNADQENKPRVIIFFAPPYCPHNYLKVDNKDSKNKLKLIESVLSEVEKETGEDLELKKFFPYLSDSSYLSIHESDDEIDTLMNNFPQWSRIYPVPIKDIRELDITAINIGVYGKDAHKWTERVNKPYTFNVLPELILKMTTRILQSNVEKISC